MCILLVFQLCGVSFAKTYKTQRLYICGFVATIETREKVEQPVGMGRHSQTQRYLLQETQGGCNLDGLETPETCEFDLTTYICQ